MVARADPSGRYGWLPAPSRGDTTVVLDELAGFDLAARDPIPFDRLESWEERNAAEHHMADLLKAIGEHPSVAAIEHRGFPLYEFAEYRLRPEVAMFLRGWTVARVGAAAGELTCDPALSPAFLIGVRAGLGLDLGATPYVLPPALPGSRRRRQVARQMMRVLAMASRPERVSVAAVAAGKLSLALASLSAEDTREAGLGLMPFPGLDHGNGLLLALRWRLPLLATYGPAHIGARVAMNLPERLEVEPEAALDRALTLLVRLVLTGAAPEQEQAVRALGGMGRARSLRAVVLPSAAYGASRLLIRWAHERGLRVGSMQHGIYVFRDYDGGDRRADVLFGWGEGTTEQTCAWVEPRPAVLPVGVPGTPPAPFRPVRASLTHMLIATTNTLETPITPVASCETFLRTLAPGLRHLAAAGVDLELRPHPNEDPARYRRLLDTLGLSLRVSAEGSFRAAAEPTDILVSSGSSVAFEAAALGLPVLLWVGGTPKWVRAQHLVAPWTESPPGTFETSGDFEYLVEALLDRRAQGLDLAMELSRRLARYAQPFDRAAFAAGLRMLGE